MIVHGHHRLLLAPDHEPLRDVLDQQRRHALVGEHAVRARGRRGGCRLAHRLGLRLFQETGHLGFLFLISHHPARLVSLISCEEPRSLRGPRLLSSPMGEHQKTVDPIWPTARGFCLAALPPGFSSRGAQISRLDATGGRHGASNRALHRSLMAGSHVLVERFRRAAPHVGEAGGAAAGGYDPASRRVKPITVRASVPDGRALRLSPAAARPVSIFVAAPDGC